MDILICADAQPQVGTGHLRRMLTLAGSLIESAPNIQLTIRTSTLGASIAREIGPRGLQIAEASCSPEAVKAHLENKRYAAVILDNYHWNEQNEAPLRALTDCLCVIDDLADRPHDVDLLLDQNAYHSDRDYVGLAPSDCTLLAGAEFCLLSRQFRTEQVRTANPLLLESAAPIFVSLGGGDPNRDLLPITQTLLANTPFSLTLATGSHIADAEALQSLVKQHSDRVELIFDSPRVAEQMLKSKFAVASGGTMTWERAAVGLPSLCLIVADNQYKSAHWLADRNVHDIFDIRASWSPKKLAQAALALGSDKKRQTDYFNASRALSLENGVVRVATTLLKKINATQY